MSGISRKIGNSLTATRQAHSIEFFFLFNVVLERVRISLLSTACQLTIGCIDVHRLLRLALSVSWKR